MSKGIKVLLVTLAVVVLVGFLLAGKIIGGYNRVVSMDENVKGKWAQVEKSVENGVTISSPIWWKPSKVMPLTRRKLFENIAQARTQYFQAKGVNNQVQASNQLEGALSRLLLLKEQYPELKANQSFLKTPGQPGRNGKPHRRGAQNGINDSVQILNTYIRTFMGRFYAHVRRGGKSRILRNTGIGKSSPASEILMIIKRVHQHRDVEKIP